MELGIKNKLYTWITSWLTYEPDIPTDSPPLYNYERLSYEVRPGDVILVEGRSKVSEVIKLITQSAWTHAALYIGRLHDIEDAELKARVTENSDIAPNEPLVIEAYLGEGTIVSPLRKYEKEHLRLCRPKGLSPGDAQQVIRYAINRIGHDYNLRQILDLARFLFPYVYLPRRWRSSLFTRNAGDPTRTVCSTMLAEAFQEVKFPLLPFAEITEENKIHLYQRNPRLVTPKDFDYSPYFDIIKYPFFGLDDISIYRHLPWRNKDIYCNDINDCYSAPAEDAMAEAAKGLTANDLKTDTDSEPDSNKETDTDSGPESIQEDKPYKYTGVDPQDNTIREQGTEPPAEELKTKDEGKIAEGDKQ